METTLDCLRNSFLFSNLSEKELGELAEKASIRNFRKNAILINEGDESGPLHLILSGKVRVFLSNSDGKEVTLREQGPGSYFGELSLLDDEPRSASVITLENTNCALISKKDFKDWLAAHPLAAMRLITELIQRIRLLTSNVKGLALSDVYGRLIEVLHELAREENGRQVVHPKPTQQELANRVGASREMISRIFKELTRGDYIAVNRKTLVIKKKLPPSW